MGRGYQPVQSWAIMMEVRGAKIIVYLRIPARPVDALSESPFDRCAAVKMDLNVTGFHRYAVNLPKRAGDNGRQKDNKKYDQEAERIPVRHIRKYTKS